MNANTRHSLRPVIAIFAVIALVLGAMMSFGARSSSAASVEPVYVEGNPTCQDLGYDFEFKVDPPNAGTYSIDGMHSVTVTTDGVYFDWSSNLGMDAVISKGGPNANVYVYDPPAERTSDTGLHSPINPENGEPYGLSHISFCYDYELSVSKSANASYTRTYTWGIDKSVSPETWDLFVGDSGTSAYTIDVKRTVTDSDFLVSGEIQITNPSPFMVSFDVSDVYSGSSATVSCPAYEAAPGATITCSYQLSLTEKADGTNTATVTSLNPNVSGGTASASVVFGEPTNVVGYASVNVVDSNGGAWLFNDTGSVSYTRTFTCGGDAGTHANTATIVETGMSDDASVSVNCYALTVTKDVETERTRTWTWTIDKVGDQTELMLSTGQVFTVNYDVTVDAISEYSNRIVSGSISVFNPAPMAATINSVSDVVSPDFPATVSCNVTFPYQLASGATLTCSYALELPDMAPRTNTATATLQNYAYDPFKVGTPTGTSNFSSEPMPVDFSLGSTIEIDECIDVTDDQYGLLGSVCADDAPKTFKYSMNVGPYAECGTYTFVNIASFVTNDTSATGSDSWTVKIDVPCMGCTLTQGYWKTHSEYGPAPEDDAWMNLGDADGDTFFEGPDEMFFLSGKTYLQVLNTPPAGNPYYILAQQYIAAELNIANGADSTDVDATMESVKAFFTEYGPATKWTKAQKTMMTSWSMILDNYNNGLIGPGHCSEEMPS